jgi:hypothetical protein
MNYIEIQQWPEIPQIGFFASLFRTDFKLPEFDVEDLENALLLINNTNDETFNDDILEVSNPNLLEDFIVSLLKGCDVLRNSRSSITINNYQEYLVKIFNYKCEERVYSNVGNPFETCDDFYSLSLRNKVLVLNYLCEFRKSTNILSHQNQFLNRYISFTLFLRSRLVRRWYNYHQI